MVGVCPGNPGAIIAALDPHVRERLTGAAVLVALLVLLVPELLTGRSAERTASDAERGQRAEIGSRMRSYTIDLADKQPPAAAPMTVASTEAPAGTGRSVEDAPRVPSEPRSVTSSTLPPPDSAAAAPTQSGGTPQQRHPASWSVQVGTFSNRDNAERLARDLVARGFEAFVAPFRSGSRELYRVRVSAGESRADAQAMSARLEAAGHGRTALVPPS